MFEQIFKNVDDVLWKDAGCSSELDYVEQTSWVLFLKYIDELEKEISNKDVEGKKSLSYANTSDFLPNTTGLTILKCLYEIDTNTGRTLLSLILIGSKSKPIFNTGTNKNSYYGYLRKYDKDKIMDMIDQLISSNYISIYKSDAAFKRPLIRLTEKGKQSIDMNEGM